MHMHMLWPTTGCCSSSMSKSPKVPPFLSGRIDKVASHGNRRKPEADDGKQRRSKRTAKEKRRQARQKARRSGSDGVVRTKRRRDTMTREWAADLNLTAKDVLDIGAGGAAMDKGSAKEWRKKARAAEGLQKYEKPLNIPRKMYTGLRKKAAQRQAAAEKLAWEAGMASSADKKKRRKGGQRSGFSGTGETQQQRRDKLRNDHSGMRATVGDGTRSLHGSVGHFKKGVLTVPKHLIKARARADGDHSKGRKGRKGR